MPVRIEFLKKGSEVSWDAYVLKHPRGTPYHLSGWRRAIEKAYGHRSYCLIALRGSADASDAGPEEITGVLPLIHLKHVLFGNSLISLPFCDMGGVIADDDAAEAALVRRAIRLSRDVGCGTIELRHAFPHACLS
ncbi:MAG: hypothetical protein JXI32_09320, partial [Deltaproteobacteria bacterium]|nr:hypothetical protein [Deltaproteobacteria bacterium]